MPPLTVSFWFQQTAIFELLASQIPGAKVVILHSCDYPTDVAADVLRRNAIRIAELRSSQDHLISLSH